MAGAMKDRKQDAEHTKTTDECVDKNWSGFDIFELVNSVGMMSFKKLMECPICFDICIPPVRVCKTGHHICGDCETVVKECGICSAKFEGTRNCFYEDCFEKSQFNCKYRNEGCKQILFGNELKDHRRYCDFRPIACFCCGKTDVPYTQYLKHYAAKLHKEITSSVNGEFQDNYIHDFSASGFGNNKAVKFNERTFFPVVVVQQGGTQNPRVGIFVSIFGNEEDTYMYNVRISMETVAGKGLKRRKYKTSWEGPVVSIRTPRKKILESGKCFTTSAAAIKALCGQQSELDYDYDDWTVSYKIIPVTNNEDKL